MFRQIAPKGIVNKQPINTKIPVPSTDEPNSDIVAEAAAPLASPLRAQQDDHEPAGPLLPHESSQENLAESETHEGKPDFVNGEGKVSEDSCAVADGSPLAHHDPAGPLLPHGSFQENIAGDGFPEDDGEFLDAHEHPISNVEGKMKDMSLQAEAVDKVETVPVLPSSHDQVKSRVGEDENGQNVTEKKSETISKETNIAPEVVDAKVTPGQSKDNAQIDLTQIENPTMMEVPKTEPADIESAQSTADEVPGDFHAVVPEAQIKPDEGEAVAVSNENVETIMTHEEMGRITPAECPFFNRE